jgi:hypothetical protein
MSLQESIKRILREETELPIFIRRRFTMKELDKLINNVEDAILKYGDDKHIDDTIYDEVREFIKERRFDDIDEFGDDQDYWRTYLKYETPLVKYVKHRIDNKLVKEQEDYFQQKEKRIQKEKKFQKLIDSEIQIMKNICEYMDAESEDEFISFDACDFLDLDPKVRVTSVDKLNGVSRILVVIEYEAMMHFHDEETFISELQYRLRKWITNVNIEVEDVLNTYPDEKRQW